MSDQGPREMSSAADLDALWRKQVVWWHVAFAVVLSLLAFLVTQSSGPQAPRLTIVGLILVAYVALGARALTRQEPAVVRAYVAVLCLLFVALLFFSRQGVEWLLSVVVFSQVWALLPRRSAVTASLVVAFAGQVAMMLGSGEAGSLTRWGAALLGGGVTAGFAIGMGLFIDSMVGEAAKRARMLDELHLAQGKLATAERAAGVYAERERLSREIHDTLAQGFTSILALATAADSALAREDVMAVRERLQLINTTARDNLSEARLIVAELSPGHLDSRTLSEALARLTAAVSGETGLAATFTTVGEPVALGVTREVVIVRTAQEALSNIRRHAQARTARVTLSYDDPDSVTLEVVDDGVGLVGQPGRSIEAAGSAESGDVARSGFGLDGVRARAREVGGQAHIDAVPSGGTRVLVEVPR